MSKVGNKDKIRSPFGGSRQLADNRARPLASHPPGRSNWNSDPLIREAVRRGAPATYNPASEDDGESGLAAMITAREIIKIPIRRWTP